MEASRNERSNKGIGSPWRGYQPFLFVLTLICVVTSIGVKLPGLSDPFFGSHLFRQLQTLSTIESFAREGIDLLHPRTNYIGYPGYLLLELPVFQAAAALLSRAFGDPLVTTRVLNLIIGLLCSWQVYRISRLFFSLSASAAAAVFALIAPINLMYHASTLIDPLAVFGTLVCISIVLSKNEGQPYPRIRMLGFFLFSTLTLLIKPLYYFPVCLLVIYHPMQTFVTTRSPLAVVTGILTERRMWTSIVLSGLILVAWLLTSASLSSAQDVTSHLGWRVLTQPSFYLTIALRFLFYIQTPLQLLFVIIGVLAFVRDPGKRRFVIVAAILPFFYYLTFANINKPHDYYSLILVPFLAILAGAGVEWIWKSLPDNLNRSLFVPTVIALATLLSVFLYFTNYWLSPNLKNRYREVYELTQENLEPYQFAIVWVNPHGGFEQNEYLGESRRKIIQAKLGTLNPGGLRADIRPIYAPPMLYALNHQYGEMRWHTSLPDEQEIQEIAAAYEGKLRYIAAYLPDHTKELKNRYSFSLVLDSDELLVWELNTHQSGS